MMTTMYKLLLFNLKAKFCQIDAQKHGKQIENQMLVANNRQSEWIGLQMMITMTVSQATIKVMPVGILYISEVAETKFRLQTRN